MLYHRDLRRLESLNRALEKVNLIANEKLRNLSRLNGTLYEFVLDEETRDSGEKAVVRHVIPKSRCARFLATHALATTTRDEPRLLFQPELLRSGK